MSCLGLDLSLSGSGCLLRSQAGSLCAVFLLLEGALQRLVSSIRSRELLGGGGFGSLARFLTRCCLAFGTLLAFKLQIGLGLRGGLCRVGRMLLFKLRGDGTRRLAFLGRDLAADLFLLLRRDVLFTPRAGVAVDVQVGRISETISGTRT